MMRPFQSVLSQSPSNCGVSPQQFRSASREAQTSDFKRDAKKVLSSIRWKKGKSFGTQ